MLWGFAWAKSLILRNNFKQPCGFKENVQHFVDNNATSGYLTGGAKLGEI